MNEAEASNDAFKNYILYNDSVRNDELATKVNALETRFRTLEKDKAIKAKELTLAQKDLELKKKNTWIYFSLGSILVLLVTGGWGWMSYRQKQLLQAQKILTLQREQEVGVLQAMMQGEEQEPLVQLSLHEDMFSMTVEDNGRGFDTAVLKAGTGLGLYDLQERMDAFNGNVQIDTSRAGTSVVIDFHPDPVLLRKTRTTATSINL